MEVNALFKHQRYTTVVCPPNHHSNVHKNGTTCSMKQQTTSSHETDVRVMEVKSHAHVLPFVRARRRGLVGTGTRWGPGWACGATRLSCSVTQHAVAQLGSILGTR